MRTTGGLVGLRREAATWRKTGKRGERHQERELSCWEGLCWVLQREGGGGGGVAGTQEEGKKWGGPAEKRREAEGRSRGPPER